MKQVVINGKAYSFEEGKTILNLLNIIGIEIPSLCHDDRLHPYGETSLPVVVDSTLKKGEVFSTFSNNKVFMNKITNPSRDNYTQTPEYKITAVRIEKITV